MHTVERAPLPTLDPIHPNLLDRRHVEQQQPRMSGEERAGEEEEEARDGNDGDLLAVEGWPRTRWKVQRMCVGD